MMKLPMPFWPARPQAETVGWLYALLTDVTSPANEINTLLNWRVSCLGCGGGSLQTWSRYMRKIVPAQQGCSVLLIEA